MEPSSGPEQIIPSEKYVTSDIFSAVKLRIKDGETSDVPPMSVPSVLEKAAKAAPNHTALAYKKNPEDTGFHYITFREYHNLTRTVARAFLKLGLERLHSVAILGFNSPEWFLSFLGCIHAGGVGCGIYTTNSAEATFYCLEKGMANIAVVEDDGQAQKVLKYKDKLPKLKAVVQYSGKPTSEGVLGWEQLLQIGEKEDDTRLNEVVKRIAVNQCCALIYTSGTTGNPKGVMLSHDNLMWLAHSVTSILSVAPQQERIISYLPLSHAAALVVDILCQLVGQVSIYFANKDALKGGLIKTLLEVKPTRFLGVPRIWEKIAEKMKMVGAEAGFIKRHIAAWAKSQGLHRNLDLMKGVDSPSLGYLVAKPLIFAKIKSKLGFDECKTFWSGAAPLATDIKLYFASLDIPIMEGFGMSESTGPHTVNIPNSFRFDSAGVTIPGAETKIHNPDDDQQGEICLFGRNVFMGYLGDEKQTNEAIDENGWLHSGDIGKIDKEGFLYITGRIKELLITAGGENISPVLIEQNVKAELPFLGQAVVICDKKKFLSMLVTLSAEVDADTGEPNDQLTPVVIKWLRELNLPYSTTSEVIASGPDKKVLDAIQKGLDAANAKAISNAQKVQKFAILPKDFSMPTGELGPTLKLKRNVINDKYKSVIDKFYES
ncbi:hypothetical protein RUM44_011610 [Polyplax serrata]|uniref:long-chain-fatty-acid--CoA ligase n=1 Tax=Polyplax serrata TaxID=468196 RepID=A0ABR1AQJ6_POLSC